MKLIALLSLAWRAAAAAATSPEYVKDRYGAAATGPLALAAAITILVAML